MSLKLKNNRPLSQRKNFFILMILVVSLFSFTVASIPFKTEAQAAPVSPSEKVKKYQAAAFFDYCIAKFGTIQNRSLAEINEASIIDTFQTAFELEDMQTNVGFLADDADGRWRCDVAEDQKAALAILGLSGETLFVSTGVYQEKETKDGYVAAGSGIDQANRVKAYLKNNGIVDTTVLMSEGSRFFSLQATFKKECIGGEPSTGGTEVHLVNEQTGQIEIKRYILSDAGKMVPVGFGIDGTAKEEMSCATIVQSMDNLDDAAAAEQKKFIDDGGTEDPSDTGDTEPESTCEANNPGGFSWLFCGIIEAVDDAVGSIIEQAYDLLSVRSDLYQNDKLQQSWAYFRNIASALLVVIGLVMIIGQAVGKD